MVGILVVAFGLRLAWAIFATRTPVFIESGDAHSYFFYGRQIAEGGGYLNLDGSGRATAYYPIGYPALLGGLFWLVLHTPIPGDHALPMAASLLHVLLGTGSVALLYLVTRAATGSTRTALVAAALLALWPNAVLYTATMQLETAFTFAALAALAVLATHRWQGGDPPSLTRLAVFASVLTASALLRPFSLPFLAVPVLLLLARRAPATRIALSVTALVVPTVLLLVPWTIRNERALGAPLPFSSNMGDTVCLDRSLDAEGGFRFADHDGCADPSLGEVERNEESTRKAIDFVLEHPDREALQIVRRARLILGADHDGFDAAERGGRAPLVGDTTRSAVRTLADGWFFLALALAAAGLVRALARAQDRRAELLLLGVPLLSLLGTAVLLWGTPRFHVPAIPFLAAFAAVGISGTTPRARTTVTPKD